MMAQLNPREPRCEYIENPLGIDVPGPRLSWVVESSQRGQMQSAYRILVASSPERLGADIGDKWDSGKVESDRSINVAYEGSELTSAEKCGWKVRVWDRDGRAGPWSEPASFEMGLLEESDWQGEWIGAGSDVSGPLLRKEFEIRGEVTQARAYICGLGWYELYINGRKVGDHVLDPAASDYAKRCYYVTYDVTDLLKDGPNAIGVMLGNGWFCEPGAEGSHYGDSPRALLQLSAELAGGGSVSLVTDGTWKVSPGPITSNDFYHGEVYDARLEKTGWDSPGCDDSAWLSAEMKAAPGGRLASQLIPAIKVIKTLQPAKFSVPNPGVYVYDMGQLFGGWARLRVQGPGGVKVSIRYSARLDEDTGLIDDHRHPEPGETDYYILKGNPEGETYEARFAHHPVRYVQVENAPCELTRLDLEGRVVHTDEDLSGGFECANDLLNRIHRNVTWTFTNGLFGLPLDCLHREHWGWTDPATITGTLYPRKHVPGFWTKWLNDIRDAQREDGSVPDTAPNYRRGQGTDAAWGGNYPMIVWYLHQYYADMRLLEEHYAGMERCVDYLASVADGHLINEGHYGDHMLPGEVPGKEEFVSSETPPPLVWTGYYYCGAHVVSRAARLLGKDGDAARYAKLAAEIRDAFNAEWLDSSACQYAAGSQTANLFPLALDIVPEAARPGVIENVVRSIAEEHQDHHHAGNTGTTCMIDKLTEWGYGDLLYAVATQITYPGWGYMVAQGATTIWESWSLIAECGNAESMIMWATIDEFFYNDLAGIKGPDYYGPEYMNPGFREICIRPHIPTGLEHAGATIRTVRGMVSSRWKKTKEGIGLEVAIPVNATARISVPKTDLKDVSVTEGGRTVWESGAYFDGVEGIAGGSETRDNVTFDVGSGDYSFVLSGTPGKTGQDSRPGQRQEETS